MVTVKTVIRETAKAKLVTFEEIQGEYWVAKKLIGEDGKVDNEKYTLEDVSNPRQIVVELEKDLEDFSEKSVKAIVKLTNTLENGEKKEAEKFLFFAKTRVKWEGKKLTIEEWMWDNAIKNSRVAEEQYLVENKEEVGKLSFSGWTILD